MPAVGSPSKLLAAIVEEERQAAPAPSASVGPPHPKHALEGAAGFVVGDETSRRPCRSARVLYAPAEVPTEIEHVEGPDEAVRRFGGVGEPSAWQPLVAALGK